MAMDKRIICEIDGRRFRKGTKVRVIHPIICGGTLQHTFCSRPCAEAYLNKIRPDFKRRAKITKV